MSIGARAAPWPLCIERVYEQAAKHLEKLSSEDDEPVG
ncbi:hypothetical protein ACVWZ7_003871 [Arthrobacter sp. TE12232]